MNHSIWAPLRLPAFRGIWACSGIYFIGNAMQAMAASWLSRVREFLLPGESVSMQHYIAER